MLPVLQVEDLCVSPTKPASATPILKDVSFSVEAGEIYALVGESGSGKTITSRAILQLLPPGLSITNGRTLFNGDDISHYSTSQMLRVRGRMIGMVFQEPMTSLNPALTVGRQLAEAQMRHFGRGEEESDEHALKMLDRLQVPDGEACLRKYPHEFSGGLRQRILLAGVLALEPGLVIADEPTTALDVLIQKEVLELMVGAVREIGSSVLLITHDLGVVAKYANRIGVLQLGKLLEEAPTESLLQVQNHAYTQKLLSAIPQRGKPGQRVAVDAEAVVKVDNVAVDYFKSRLLPWRPPVATRVLEGAELVIQSGETLAVVGESGSGKTTLAKAILGLVPVVEGRIRIGRDEVVGRSARHLSAIRKHVQMIFQDPYSALNPRLRVDQIVAEGLRHERVSRADIRERVEKILFEVGLSGEYGGRYPHQLSGGQRQRVNIARALIANPKLVVADEPVSALDVTVQAEILRMFTRLREKRQFACMFISHDLSVVESLADRVLVIYRGEIVEEGMCQQIFMKPRHPYTRALLKAAPRLVRDRDRYRLADDDYEEIEPPPEHEFDGWRARPSPRRPERVEVAAGHWVTCYAA